MCGHTAGPGETGAGERPTHVRKSACGRGGSHIPGQSGLFLKRFIYLLSLWLPWGFAPARRLSLLMASGGPSPVAVLGLRIAVASPAVEHRPWSTGSVVVVLGLSWPSACEHFLDHGSNPSIGKQILNHSDQGSPKWTSNKWWVPWDSL